MSSQNAFGLSNSSSSCIRSCTILCISSNVESRSVLYFSIVQEYFQFLWYCLLVPKSFQASVSCLTGLLRLLQTCARRVSYPFGMKGRRMCSRNNHSGQSTSRGRKKLHHTLPHMKGLCKTIRRHKRFLFESNAHV